MSATVWRGDRGYESARVDPVFNARRPERYPAGIVFAESIEDVAAAVRLARARGLMVSVRSGGHSWGAWGLRDGALLVDLSRMRELAIDDARACATAGPGVRGGVDLTPFLAAHERAFPGGHCDTVGISGFLLQGGQGWNSRVWGWACENVVAIDVVTADGELVHASEHENSDLLWAARGAGPGFFGVVVRWHLRVHALARWPSQTNIVWNIDDFDDVMRWAHEMLPRCEPVCEPVFASIWGPSLPWLAHGGRGQGRVLILHATAMVDSQEEAERVFAPLAACPLVDRALHCEVALPTTMEGEFVAMTGANPPGCRYATDCIWTDAGADELIPLMRPAFVDPPTERTFSIWYGWDPPAERPDMAFSVEGNVYLATYAIWDDPLDDARCRAWVTATYRALQAVGKGAYTGDADFLERPDRFVSDERFARLEQIRRQRDPDGIFVSWALGPGAQANVPQPVGP